MVDKQRRGYRIWKKDDEHKTPYRRNCESPEVTGKIKREMEREYEKIKDGAVGPADRLASELPFA